MKDSKATCKVCGVLIDGDVVHFSHGKPGTKARLCARVCQYIDRKRGCINDVDTFFVSTDCYDTGQDLNYRKEGSKVHSSFIGMARDILKDLGVEDYDEKQGSGKPTSDVE